MKFSVESAESAKTASLKSGPAAMPAGASLAEKGASVRTVVLTRAAASSKESGLPLRSPATRPTNSFAACSARSMAMPCAIRATMAGLTVSNSLRCLIIFGSAFSTALVAEAAALVSVAGIISLNSSPWSS